MKLFPEDIDFGDEIEFEEVDTTTTNPRAIPQQYKDWIVMHVPGDPELIHNECHKYSKMMAHDYPELTLTRGHVLLTNVWERSHWWLVDPNGDVVDPTAHQFKGSYFGKAGIIMYNPHDESQPEPTGICPNCSEYCYNGDAVCSDACGTSYVNYINAEIRRNGW